MGKNAAVATFITHIIYMDHLMFVHASTVKVTFALFGHTYYAFFADAVAGETSSAVRLFILLRQFALRP